MANIRITITSEKPASIEVIQRRPGKKKPVEDELRELLKPLLDGGQKRCD